MKHWILAGLVAAGTLAGCGSDSATPAPKNVIFFLGDGMGVTTLTASRIYSVGEDGDMTIATLPETAFVRTYSNNAQVTDSAPSMAAYMTGVKMNNEVVSMTPETMAFDATGKDYLSGADSTCPSWGNGSAVPPLLEIAKAAMGTGAVTTTRITHATPAVTYAHICHRDAENNIAAQAVPGGSGYNSALGDGVDVMLGGGRRHFIPKTATGSKRSDGRDLTAEFQAKGYTYVKSNTELKTVSASSTNKLLGLFNADHMNYDLDRLEDSTIDEPSLADMTTKAIDILSKNPKGFFLMVEGGRIDHALHDTRAKKALQDTVAFDAAIKTAIDKMKVIDPDLKNTLIVVTADHDHTLVLNGYAARTGKTSATEPGVLGLVKSYVNKALSLVDINNMPYTIIGFGNGPNRPGSRTALDDATVTAKTYQQEATVPVADGSETHGGTDVFLGAIGRGAENFTGIINNTEVFGLIRKAIGL